MTSYKQFYYKVDLFCSKTLDPGRESLQVRLLP